MFAIENSPGEMRQFWSMGTKELILATSELQASLPDVIR
jgi:hypothetical protein